MGKAIVLGQTKTALGVIHALASEGVKVIYLSTSQSNGDFSHFSRFVSQYVKVPSPKDGRDELIQLLMGTKQDWKGALLIPTNDLSVTFVSQNRDALGTRYVIPVQKWDIVRRILNKRSLYLKAKEIGVPTPRFLFPDSVESLLRKQNYLRYPCILKPFESWRFAEIFGKKVLIVNNFEELINKYMLTQHHNIDVMVSEIITGADSCFYHYRCYIDRKSSVLSEMCTQKLQQTPPVFGVARVSKTIPMIEEIRQLALSLLKSFSYNGVSSTEFKFDIRDKKYKLIEINVRPVLPERLFIEAGVNFPYITYLDYVEKIKPPASSYTSEIYWIDLFEEISELIRMLAGKKFLISNYLWPYRKKRKVLCIPFLYDPLPFVVGGFDLIIKIWKNIINRLRS
jgi:predicted ATP-grasp superfamily ATP-dependent carboligase